MNNNSKAIIHNDYDAAVIGKLTQVSLCYTFLRNNVVTLNHVSACIGMPLEFVEMCKNELLIKDKIYIQYRSCKVTGNFIEHYTTNLKLL